MIQPDVVVDVGNTRMKWGRCADARIAQCVAVPPEDPMAWQQQLETWNLRGPLQWGVSGVHPERRDLLARWLRRRGDRVFLLDSGPNLPIRIQVDQPAGVGLDRLLNGIAANSRRPEGMPAVVVDAGSAVTVDWLDEAGAFCGGAIFPGFRLMSQALHDYTALLPLVAMGDQVPAMPGAATVPAIQAGVFWAVVGGVQALTEQLRVMQVKKTGGLHPSLAGKIFLTGGDAPLLQKGFLSLPDPLAAELWPEMTLEGVRLAVERLS